MQECAAGSQCMDACGKGSDSDGGRATSDTDASAHRNGKDGAAP
jgi:hypothetical protein